MCRQLNGLSRVAGQRTIILRVNGTGDWSVSNPRSEYGQPAVNERRKLDCGNDLASPGGRVLHGLASSSDRLCADSTRLLFAGQAPNVALLI